MVSIAVELSRGDRVATAPPTLAPPGNIKSNFAHSLLVNGVESVLKPAPTEVHVNKNAVASESVPKKEATVGVNVAAGPIKFAEAESGSSAPQASSKPVAARNTAMVNGAPTAKVEPIGGWSGARTAKVKRLEINRNADISEKRNLDSPETKRLAVSETKVDASEAKKSDGSESKHLEEGKAAPGPIADEAPMGDVVSAQGFTPTNGTSLPLGNVKDSEVLATVSSVRPAGDKQSESVTTTLPTAAAATHRETKGGQDDAVHPVKLSEGSSDTASNAAAKDEQPKNSAVAVSADLASGNLTGAGKAEAGIASAVAAVQHVGSGSPGQVHSAAFSGDGSPASFGPVAHQGSVADVTPSVASHNSAYSDEPTSTRESGPGLLTATPTSLEVGIANGTHGWLKIRAEMEDGVVTASLSPGSMAAQEMLHRELPSLVAYLQEEKLGVNTLVVKPSQMTDATGTNADGNLQGQGQSSQQRPDSTWNGVGSGDESSWDRAKQGQEFEVWNSFGGGSGFLPSMGGDLGSWLNVRV